MNSSASTSTANGFEQARDAVRGRWQALGDNERRALSWLTLILSLTLVWTLALRPAWRTLQSAPQELDRLEAQLQDMNRLAIESRELRAATPVSVAQATASLQAATARLGPQGRLTVQGERITLTVSGITPEALKDWLGEARRAARVRPLEAQLSRGGSGYSGTIQLAFGGTP